MNWIIAAGFVGPTVALVLFEIFGLLKGERRDSL